MLTIISILFGKLIIIFSSIANLGSGSTWPGHIALKLNKNFIKDVLKNSKTKGIILTDHDYRNVLDVANCYCLIYDGGIKEIIQGRQGNGFYGPDG